MRENCLPWKRNLEVNVKSFESVTKKRQEERENTNDRARAVFRFINTRHFKMVSKGLMSEKSYPKNIHKNTNSIHTLEHNHVNAKFEKEFNKKRVSNLRYLLTICDVVMI